MNRIILIGLLFISPLAISQVQTRTYMNDPLRASREHVVDFLAMKLDISFEPEKKLVKGKVTHRFVALRQKVDSIVLDGINMDIKEVILHGQQAKFRNNNAQVIIYTPSIPAGQKDSMTITYEAIPRKGLYFIGWNDKTGICRRQIWSQGQGINNRNWIPMYDEMNDKVITEMVITFDSTYRVISNGKLITKKISKNGLCTWHYKMSRPHAPYLIMLGIGKYDIKEMKSVSGIPIDLWYYADWKDRIEKTYKLSVEMMDFYEKEIGIPYPWESYSQIPVQDFLHGAMENTTATVFGDFFMVDERAFLDRNYISVNAHELAHQWFGDYVTARSAAHHWLQESFATYYSWLFEREIFGENHFDWLRRDAQNKALSEALKNNFPIVHSEAGSVRHYPKGACVLNMLKYVLGGKEMYNKCIKHYLNQHPYGSVDSEDLQVACEEITGMSLNWFFEEWAYKGGEPAYKITFRDITADAPGKNGSRYSEFLIQQTQDMTDLIGLPRAGYKTSNEAKDAFVQSPEKEPSRPAGLWKMPVWVEVHYTDGTADRKQSWIEEQTETIRIPVPAGKNISFALFDPDNEILKSVSFSKPFDMLQAQAVQAESVLDRYDAIAAMENIGLDRKREFLISLYTATEKSNFHAIKSEIIRQLSQDNNKKSVQILKMALNDTDVKVRKSVIDNMKLLPQELLPEVEKLLKDPSYEVILTVLDYLSFANPGNTAFYLEQTKDIEGIPGRNVKIKWLEIAAMSNEKYMDQLVSYASNAYEFRTRVNAINSLKKLNYLDQNLIEYLTEALLSANGRLSGPASDAISYYYVQLRYKRQIINYVESKEWLPWEDKIIRKVVI